MSVQRKPLSDLLSISFNQDAGCFCCGMVDGFRVMNSEPLTEAYRRDFQGGVGVAEMVFRWNILALVGGGPAPKWPREKVMIWDDKERRPIGELAFRTSVRAVRLRKDRIAVALEHRVLLYDMEELRVVHEAETAPNPGGLLALSPAAGSAVLACPGLHAGQVRVELLDTRRTRFVDAHSSGLAALALCASGRLLATASEKGTVLRVFSTADGARLRELRRGSDPARVFSVAFSREERGPEWLAVTSDKGTAHVFSLGGAAPGGGGGAAAAGGAEARPGGGGGSGGGAFGTSPSGRPTSALAFVGRYVPGRVGGAYFAAERSFAQHRLPDGHRTVVAFGREPATLLVASLTGAFLRLGFDPGRAGACEVLAAANFIDPGA